MKQKFLLFALIALILVLPVHQAQAATFWDGLGTALQKIVTGATDIFSIPYAIALQIIQAITGILPLVAGELFRVALNFNATISLIPSAGAQDMVTVGFQFTRDIANMLFILILAWVGFATILRLKSYEIKEIVPKLVVIALLINFIPVIAGVILDIASIVTKIFADKSTNIALYIWQLLPGVSMIQGGTTNLTALIPGNGGISGMAVASLMGIVFNLIAFFMLELYALIFIMRIVAIWILIVLAPLAWLGYIIPQGKKMWDMWWKQFIQWAIIGIPLTFFLYLSTFVLNKSSFQCKLIEGPNFEQYNVVSAVLSGFINKDLICSALPFLAGVIVMLVGFILSITLSPMGADMVIKQAKKGGIAAAKVGGTAFRNGPLKNYGKGLGKSLVFPWKTGYKSGRDSWKELTTTGSLKAAAKRGWSTAKTETVKMAGGSKDWVTMGLGDKTKRKAAGAGTWKAIKGMATAGAVGAGLQKKKVTAKKTCPGDPGSPCGKFIPGDENPCHFCGHIFP